MVAIHPSEAQLQAFLAGPEDGPIVMINLLRWRERAEYPAGTSEPPCSGQEAYGRYSEGVTPLLAAAGGRPVWIGLGRATLIAPDGETWDQAILVEYPSRKAFLEMTTSADYQAIAHHRTAALADSRLIATSGTLVPPPPAMPVPPPPGATA
ncbi:MAG TPA: DUF1330 domain-containing protein [Myxococcota bacterium]|nr:DUF1330 domain-containing protein [Myxococcota bacterium]